MKIGNLFIEKLFAKEIDEIRKVYKSYIEKEIDIKQQQILYTDEIERILKLKNEVKDLLKISYQVESSDILELNLEGLNASRWEGFASEEVRSIIDGSESSLVQIGVKINTSKSTSIELTTN